MNTEQIMALVKRLRELDHSTQYVSAKHEYEALQAVIERLVQERDVLKHRSEYLAAALADAQNKSDKLDIKLVYTAAENKTLRDELEKINAQKPDAYRRKLTGHVVWKWVYGDWDDAFHGDEPLYTRSKP